MIDLMALGFLAYSLPIIVGVIADGFIVSVRRGTRERADERAARAAGFASARSMRRAMQLQDEMRKRR